MLFCIMSSSSSDCSPLEARTSTALRLKRLQVFDQVELLLLSERQLEEVAVVVNYIQQRCEPPIVIKAALLMSPNPFKRRCAVRFIWRAFGLEIINADLPGLVHVPTGLGKQRRDVTHRTLRF